MIRSFRHLQQVNPGFDSDNVLTMTLSVAQNKFQSPGQQIAFFEQTLQRVRTLPGVESAGMIDDIPWMVTVRTNQSQSKAGPL